MNSCLTTLLLVTALINKASSQQDYYCFQPVDVAVLIDSSAYFGSQNFDELKTVAKNFVTYFELSENRLGPFIGFIPYSDTVDPSKVINFRYSTSVRRLTKKINNKLKFDGGRGTRLDLALKNARESLFKRNKGSRTWIPHVVVAITGSMKYWDTQGSLRDDIKREALALRAQGIQLLIAAIGSSDTANRAYLESMVATSDDVFMVRYSYGLMQVAEKMVRQLCPAPVKTFSCPGKVDMAFILDSSGSISDDDYNKMKYFVYSIAKALNVTKTGAHAGVVIYSKFGELSIKFSDHDDIESFRKAVYNLKHMKSFTRIDLGLKVAHSQLFSPIYGGARAEVKKLAFILTDGRQTELAGVKSVKVSLREAAKPLIDSGIKTLSIGIGHVVDRNELRAMVESDEDVITAVNFDELVKRIQNISQLTCEEVAFTQCKHPADIAFLMDSSNNVRYDQFEKIKEFIKTIAKLFKISQYGTHSAVIVYGNQADLSVKMNSNGNSSSFIKAVDQLWRVGGRRLSSKAFELAEDVLSDYSAGARRRIPKVVVYFTAGPESSVRDVAALRAAAKRLRDRSVLVFPIGIGSGVDSVQLSPLTQSSANVFRVKSFTQLGDQLAPLTDQVCESIGPKICEKAVDVAFIIDSSGSIGLNEFSDARRFVENVAKTFQISPQKAHVALMIYSDEARVVTRWDKIKSQEDLRAELDALPHLRGKTRIDLALKLAGADLFRSNGGMRPTPVPKVAIVITDGRQSPAADAIRLDEAAAPLLVKSIKVLSIGVGDKIDQYELNMMVDKPEEQTFRAQSYRALDTQLAAIAREICW